MASKPKPTIAERAREMVCPECGGPVERKSKHGPRPTFCSSEHAKAFNVRAQKEGAAIIAFVKAWRIDRGAGEIAQSSLQQLCQIVDGFNASDHSAQPPRPRADLYAAKLMADGRLYMDRRR
jgi:hypothetical protein